MACLRDTDVNTLQNINTNINRNAYFGTFLLVPVIDGTFITQSATKALAEGKVNGVCGRAGRLGSILTFTSLGSPSRRNEHI
jgi:hypothetical protein